MVYSNGVSTLFMDMWGGEILTIPEIHIQTTLRQYCPTQGGRYPPMVFHA